MAYSPASFLILSLLSLLACAARGQLSATFYARTCPRLEGIVSSVMVPAVYLEPRLGAFILRLFFHDCFVNGCDASVLLDDTATLRGEKNALPNKNSLGGFEVIDFIKTHVEAACKATVSCADIIALASRDAVALGCDASILLDDTATFTGEKNAGPNKNSARGFEIIDAIKTRVEAACSRTVSCADILALAARDGVVLLGGPTWAVQSGRRDSTTASQSAANSNLPSPSSSLSTLISAFSAKGLTARDMTALSGAHTIGQAQCTNFGSHIYNDTDIDPTFAAQRRQNCPAGGGDSNLAPLDLQTPNRFGNSYYQNLVGHKGLLHSDQELFNNGTQDSLVRQYSVNGVAFASDFAAAMVKMGSISPLTGTSGEVRLNCRKVN